MSADEPVRLFLFDDARARAWTPLAETRPVGELLFGCHLQRERAERLFRTTCAGHLAGSALVGFSEPGAPPGVAHATVGDRGVRLLLSSRAVPEGSLPDVLRAGLREPGTVDAPLRLVMTPEPGDGGSAVTVGWLLPEGVALPSPERLAEPDGDRGAAPEAETAALDGEILAWPWTLLARNDARIRRDVTALQPRADSFLLGDTPTRGDHPIHIGKGATVEPSVMLDLRDGPIYLDDRVEVLGPARLVGPLFIGRDSVVYGGSVGPASIGPVCKVRGEIDTSVLLGYCNKAHDGYLGHAYLGRWVNLGAGTTNSDLKNSYSPVRVPVAPDDEIDTGLLKVGGFLGDHVKTGIGTLLNTGTVIGAGSNVFGGAMPPRWVPPFSWGTGADLVEYRLDKFLEVAEAAMARRDVVLEQGMRDVLSALWESTRGQRERAGGGADR